MSKREGDDHDDRAAALLAALGQSARDIRSENAELERVALGGAPSRSLADVEGRLLDAAHPLSGEVRERILAQACQSSPPKKVKASRRGRWQWGMAVSVPLAAAAALTLFVTTRRGDPMLPAYSIEIVGSQSTMREAPKAPHTSGVGRLGDEAPLIVVARPASRPPYPIEAFAFARQGSAWVPLSADVRVAEEGSARMQLAAPALREVDELRFVIAPRGTSAEDARVRAERGDALSVRLEHPPSR